MPDAIVYPTSLPTPRAIDVAPTERRAFEGMEGNAPTSLRAIQRDYLATARIAHLFTAAQLDAWVTWWKDTLHYGGAWFSAPLWPFPWGRGGVVRYMGSPEVQHVGRGIRQVSMDIEIRGSSLDPVSTFPADLLFLMRFEEASTSLMRDEVTNTLFAPTGGVSIDSSGKFGQGLAVNGSVATTSKLVSGTAQATWDLMGATHDWTIYGWFKASGAMTVARVALKVYGSGLATNQEITVTVGTFSSGTQLRVSVFHPYASAFLTNARVDLAYDTAWHFVAAARVGNTLYMSVDGSAKSGLDGSTSGGTPWTSSASFRSTPGDRDLLIANNTVNTGAFVGSLDSWAIRKGTPFDVVNGFTPPTDAYGF